LQVKDFIHFWKYIQKYLKNVHPNKATQISNITKIQSSALIFFSTKRHYSVYLRFAYQQFSNITQTVSADEILFEKNEWGQMRI